MMLPMNQRIKKHIELKSPFSKVWQALTDTKQFGEWFMVKLDSPFVAGQTCHGHITYPGYEHVKFIAYIEKIEPEHYFSYKWHPYSVDESVDYSKETPTLVEFTLQQTAMGTLLTVIESGFDKIPAHRRAEAFRANDRGWAEQMENIKNYVEN
jgi:uncharacterized protein YndB with AHSA1/START domain